MHIRGIHRTLRPPLIPILKLIFGRIHAHISSELECTLIFQGADYTGQNGWVYGERHICPQKCEHNDFCSGWGVTSENGANLADKLLELEVNILLTLQRNHSGCRQNYKQL